MKGEIRITLMQINKKGNKSFEAVLNTKSESVMGTCKLVAEFSKDIVVLQKKNEMLGMRTAINGIKKSLPLQLSIESVHPNGKTSVSLLYKNYGKFVREATEKNVAEFWNLNVSHTIKWDKKGLVEIG